MNENYNINAIEKLDDIYDKMRCIRSVISYIDIDVCSFDDRDISGFNMILTDVVNEVKEVRELLFKNLKN